MVDDVSIRSSEQSKQPEDSELPPQPYHFHRCQIWQELCFEFITNFQVGGNKILEEICLDILEDYEKQKGSRHEKGTVGGTKNVDNEKLFMVRVFVK